MAANAQDRQVPQSRSQVQLSFAPVVENVAPAVVNIYTQKIVTARQFAPLFNDPFFRRFFGDMQRQFEGREREQHNSLGSGVIVESDGLIVTNRHVIEGADTIVVVLADKREFAAELVVADERTDLAFLRIDAGDERLPSVPLKDSDDVKVGDLVLAIGNPFGVGQTVTSGIVSALARSVGSNTELRSYIQTDAAINPGNSGGALVSIDGRLIGVNTAIFSKSGGSHGIGFAIPSNMVRATIAGLTPDGRLVRPWLGVYGQTVTADIAASLGMRRPQGVIVNQVHGKGSASTGNLKAGDIILAVNGHDVFSPDDVDFRIATSPVGSEAILRVLRGTDTIADRIILRPAPHVPASDETEISVRSPLAGAVVANLSPGLAEERGLNPFDDGVIIMAIRRGSPAGRLDFEPGDQVVAINGRETERVEDIVQALSSAQNTDWRIRIQRNGRTFDLVFRG
jgi:Do/DeqQ family serine protease